MSDGSSPGMMPWPQDADVVPAHVDHDEDHAALLLCGFRRSHRHYDLPGQRLWGHCMAQTRPKRLPPILSPCVLSLLSAWACDYASSADPTDRFWLSRRSADGQISSAGAARDVREWDGPAVLLLAQPLRVGSELTERRTGYAPHKEIETQEHGYRVAISCSSQNGGQVTVVRSQVRKRARAKGCQT